MKKTILTTIVFLAITFGLTAQNVAISEDNSTPDPSAMLDIQSADKGLLIPRVALQNVNTASPVSSPANGLFVYSESGAVPDGLYYWNSNNSKWVYVITANDITDFGSGEVITDTERSLVNSAVQTETDPVFTAHPANGVTDAGSGQIITNSERGLVNTALQSESDPVFTAHPANSITQAGSGKVITTTERDSLKTALQEEVDPIYNSQITDAGSGKVITTTERDSLKTALQEEVDPEVNMATANALPKWDGTALIESSIADGDSVVVSSDLNVNGKLSISDTITTNARFKDKTGLIMPVGTVMPFAGPETVVPEGWLLCDGSILNKYDNPEYSDLFDVIANYWGGTSGADFVLPDLRGLFLRGVNGIRADTLADPDTDLRKDHEGNTVGNVVGSYQGDEFKSHRHTQTLRVIGGIQWSAGGQYGADNQSPNQVSATGGNETRPKNAYVNYIIKY